MPDRTDVYSGNTPTGFPFDLYLTYDEWGLVLRLALEAHWDSDGDRVMGCAQTREWSAWAWRPDAVLADGELEQLGLTLERLDFEEATDTKATTYMEAIEREGRNACTSTSLMKWR